MNINNLLEEFLTSFKYKSPAIKKERTIEVFVNPSWKEIVVASAFSGAVRFIATLVPNKFYVFTSSILHHEVKNRIKYLLGTDIDNSKVVLHGVGEVSGNKIRVGFSGSWFFKMDKNVHDVKRWKWLEKYKVDLYTLETILDKMSSEP